MEKFVAYIRTHNEKLSIQEKENLLLELIKRVDKGELIHYFESTDNFGEKIVVAELNVE